MNDKKRDVNGKGKGKKKLKKPLIPEGPGSSDDEAVDEVRLVQDEERSEVCKHTVPQNKHK
jgi:hypothetical protein